MAIPKPYVTDRDAVATPIEPVSHEPTDFKTATVSTKQLRFNQLTTYIAGQSWDVDWFQPIRGRDDDDRPYEPGTHPVYQQYKMIQGMELKVTSPLNASQDQETKDMVLTGTANVYGVVIPTNGVVFLADVGDGREGLFSVTSVNRLSHYTTTIHEIEYQLIRYSSAELRADLMRKVQETVVFHKDFLDTGNSPLLSPEHTQYVNNMREHFGRLVDLYFHDFFSRNQKTLLVPNQAQITYDPFLVRYVRTILSTDDHAAIRHMKELNVEGDQAMYEFTLWHCLESMDHAMLALSMHEAGLVPVTHFSHIKPTLNSIAYSGVERVVYPDMHPTTVDTGYSPVNDPDLRKIIRGAARFRELDRLMRTDLVLDSALEVYEALDPSRASQIKRVTVDSYYVLSEAFYKHTPETPLSKLETLTLAALKGHAIDIQMLDHLCNNAPQWDNVERFYYIPILLTLLKIYRRRIK